MDDTAVALDTDAVIDALHGRHRSGSGWVTVAEVTVGTGSGSRELIEAGVYNVQQRIDLFAFNVWPSQGWERVAYEVKVSRSDFLREIKAPHKRQAAMALSNEFYFAAPAGLIAPDEVPDGCGLVEVYADLRTRQRVAAEHRDDPPLPRPFIASLLRCAADQRTFDRCGVNDCGRHGAWVPSMHGVKVPMCQAHYDGFSEARASSRKCGLPDREDDRG